jgi:hypothetical protein
LSRSCATWTTKIYLFIFPQDERGWILKKSQ